MKPQIEAFFDDATWTVSYVVFDEPGGHCALVDSVLDYDAKSGRTRTHSADRLVAFVQSKGLTVQWILETHAHADHLSAAHYLRSKVGGKIAIGAAITQVQEVFKAIFHLEPDFHPDGRQFDHLLHDEEVFSIGQLEAKALAVPGHTLRAWRTRSKTPCWWATHCSCPTSAPRAATSRVAMRTRCTSRCASCSACPHRPVFSCATTTPAERAPAWQTTVAAQRAHNIHVHDGMTEAAFVELRTRRDATLDMPVLILPSVQVNIRAGAMPPAEDNGVTYLKIPVNAL